MFTCSENGDGGGGRLRWLVRVGSNNGAQACAAEIVTRIIAINSRNPPIGVAPSVASCPNRSWHPGWVADHKEVPPKLGINTEGMQGGPWPPRQADVDQPERGWSNNDSVTSIRG